MQSGLAHGPFCLHGDRGDRPPERPPTVSQGRRLGVYFRSRESQAWPPEPFSVSFTVNPLCVWAPHPSQRKENENHTCFLAPSCHSCLRLPLAEPGGNRGSRSTYTRAPQDPSWSSLRHMRSPLETTAWTHPDPSTVPENPRPGVPGKAPAAGQTQSCAGGLPHMCTHMCAHDEALSVVLFCPVSPVAMRRLGQDQVQPWRT